MLDISKYLEILTNIDILGRQASASVCRAVCSESIKAQGKLGAICIILHSPGYCIITLYCRFCQSKIMNYFPGCNCFTPCNPNLCPLNLVGPVHPVHPTQPLPIMKTCCQCNSCRTAGDPKSDPSQIMKMCIYAMVVGDLVSIPPILHSHFLFWKRAFNAMVVGDPKSDPSENWLN